MKLKTILVDDEQACRDAVRAIVEQNCPQVEVVAEANSVTSAVNAILKHQPDLLLLDIEIDEGTGFEVLQQIQPENMEVIFVTGFNHFAIKAFKYSATDYILKPINPVELVQAINKVVKNGVNRSIAEKLQLMQYNNNNESKKLALPTQNGLSMIMVNEIVRCQSDNSYTTFFIDKNKKLMVSKNLKEYEDLLDDIMFMRVHQSHLVNLNFVDQFHREDGGILIMKDGSKIPVARRRKDKLLEKLTSS